MEYDDYHSLTNESKITADAGKKRRKRKRKNEKSKARRYEIMTTRKSFKQY